MQPFHLNPTLALEDSVWIGIVVGAAVVAAVVGAFVHRAMTAKDRSDADRVAKETITKAETEAKANAERIKIDAQQAALAQRQQTEKELEEQRNQARDNERRLAKREDQIERKEESLSQRDSALSKQGEAVKAREAHAEELNRKAASLVEEQKQKLLQVSGMSVEQAKSEVLRLVEDDARHEASKITRKIVEDAESEAKNKAREITLMAIQRCATEHTSESTVRTVAIPSDDIKGRIIGREGRNIRAIEKATGVDIIVDDTPGVIVVSCFDKIRQAIAVESLERLIADGRMHPARIEEVVDRVKQEIGQKVIQFGKDAVLEVNLRGIHPKVSEAMGKLQYRTSYGQNVLRHSVEVAYLCQLIAEQLGLDGTLARRCGFLHDIGKAMDHEMEGGHPKIGMDFARQFGERDQVLNAIGGHHGDIPSTSFYTPIVMAADAVSSARPGARRESMEKYVQRLQELQDIALSYKGVTEAYAIQAGREVRVMIDAAKIGDDEAFLIAHNIAKRVSEEMTFPGEIRVTVLRETRAIEYAR